jgi:hypothetical protein
LAVDEEDDMGCYGDKGAEGLLGDEVEEGGEDGGGAEVAPVDGLGIIASVIVGRH